MTTDPVQPESSISETPADNAAVPTPAVEAVSPASPAAVSAEAIASTEDSDSAGSRIREKMSAATEAMPQPQETSTGGTRERRGGAIEIPAADDLDSSLEAEISAAMSGDTTVPVTVNSGEPAAEGEAAAKEVAAGSKVKGTVQAIHGGEVFLDAGLRQNVVLQLTQFPEGKQPSVGDQLDVIIDAEDADGLIRGRIPRARHRAGGNWESLAVGQVVDCLITAVNKGGLQVTVSNLRAFMPASQVELGFAGNLEQYVGQKMTVQITEVNPKKRNLVVSRRALLQAERSEGEGEFWAQG